MHDGLYFLISDELHIQRRNFAALFDFIRLHQVASEFHRDHAELKNAMGSYAQHAELAPYVQRLAGLEATALFELEHPFLHTPLRLFPLYRSEALACALARSTHWHDAPVERADAAVFERLYARDRELLLHNVAAAQFWIDALAARYGKRGLTFSHAFVFGGSTIFTRVLMQLCKLFETRCMVLESSFSGHQFYAEERYTPLSASPDIQLPTIRGALAVRLKRDASVDAHALMTAAKNKNVRQPKPAAPPRFAEPERPVLLVVGQVVNDFSIIEQRDCPLSTLAFYRELLERCLSETDFNVIFKAHPWEQRKLHLRRAHTRDHIAHWREQLAPAQRARLIVLEHENLLALGRRADRVALLNSQAGLELAYHAGLRPSTFGRPYYEGAGFSDDYSHIGAFLDDVRAGRSRACLTLSDYDRLLEFLGYFLGLHCISNGPQGTAQLALRLAVEPRRFVPDPERGFPTLQQVTAKGRKLLRDPRRFVRDSRLLRRLTRGR